MLCGCFSKSPESTRHLCGTAGVRDWITSITELHKGLVAERKMSHLHDPVLLGPSCLWERGSCGGSSVRVRGLFYLVANPS